MPSTTVSFVASRIGPNTSPPSGTVPPKPMNHSAITRPRTLSSTRLLQHGHHRGGRAEVERTQHEDHRVGETRVRGARRGRPIVTANPTKPTRVSCFLSTLTSTVPDRQRAERGADAEDGVQRAVGERLPCRSRGRRRRWPGTG